MKNKVIGILALLCLAINSYAGEGWHLKKDAEGIKVYTSTVADGNVKAIKVVCTINATVEQLVALLLDAKAHEQWVYSTKRSYELKKIDAGHQIYYSEVSMPWPLANREIVVDLRINQRPNSKVITVKSIAVAGYVATNKNIVRVTLSDVSWTVTPINENVLKIEYVAHADPGGSVPSWVSNLFITKGPFETFKKLRKTVQLPAYKNVSFAFIQNAN